jgi:hypothetical protein
MGVPLFVHELAFLAHRSMVLEYVNGAVPEKVGSTPGKMGKEEDGSAPFILLSISADK